MNASLTASFPCGLASDFTDSLSGQPTSRTVPLESRIPELKLGPAPQDPKLAKEVERLTSVDGGDGKASTGTGSGADVVMHDAEKADQATPAASATPAPASEADKTTTDPSTTTNGLLNPTTTDLPPFPPSFRTLDIKREVELVRAARKRIRLGPEAYEASTAAGGGNSGKGKASAAGVGVGGTIGAGEAVGKPSVLLCTVHDAGET